MVVGSGSIIIESGFHYNIRLIPRKTKRVTVSRYKRCVFGRVCRVLGEYRRVE